MCMFMRYPQGRERTHMPRSVRWGDGEHLATRNHEVIRMAWMLDLGKSCIEGGPEYGSRIVGAQFEPGTQTRLVIIGCVIGELDAEMSPAGKADNEHRLIDARKFNGPHHAAQDRLEALSQFAAPARAHEDMHITAKSDHDVAALSLPIWSHPQNTVPQPLHRAINRSCHAANW
jgi:hypothetical protein